MSQIQIPQDEMVKYRALRQEISQIQNKMGELELELNEHQLVIDTLDKLDGSRKAFHLIGGVLVEQTVSEILPAVVANKDGLTNLIVQMEELLKQKAQQAVETQQKYGIQQQQTRQTPKQEEKSTDQSTAGILA